MNQVTSPESSFEPAGTTNPTPVDVTSGDKFYFSVSNTGGLRGRKRSLYLGGVNTPFMVRWPGCVPAGRVDKTAILSGVDLVPTLLAAANIALPKGYQPDGVDVLPAFLGKPFHRQKPLNWEWQGTHAKPANWPELGMRDGHWGLLMTADQKHVELYNLDNDRYQTNNLAEKLPQQVAAMIDSITTWKATLPTSPTAAKPSPAQVRPAPNRARAFLRWDVNKDGVLTFEEYRNGLTNKPNAETRFMNFDKDGNGTLSREEFVGPASTTEGQKPGTTL